MTNDKKTSRANQTRSKSERPKVWVPPSSLDAPPAPKGFRHRWIRAGGLLLARIPEEIAKQRTEYFRKQTEARDEAVDNDLMREQHPSMPINIDRQTRVTFGGTKKS
jgi:hypothetical protein